MGATNLANIAIEIFGAVLSIIIIIYLIVNDTKNTKLNRLFIRVLICNIVNLLSDAACWAVMGNTEPYAFIINYVGTFLMYSFNYIILVAFADYLFAYIASKTTVSKKYLHATRVLVVFAVLSVVISQFNHMYYYIDEANIYHRADLFIYILLSEVICMLTMGAMIVRCRKNLGKWEIAFLSSYIVLPVLAAVTQFMFYGITTIYITATLSVVIVFLGIQNEQTKLLKQRELELVESRVAIMLSQIQPHFLYNTLTTIETFYYKDGKAAAKLVRDFSSYLRENMDSLTQKDLVNFDRELEHIQIYIDIEKLRFEEQLNVVYKLETTDFRLPILSVQPLVENAVCHGVNEKLSGGTVTIATCHVPEGVKITVSDDGAGFDMSEANPQDGRSHVGIKNVRERLHAQCGGTLTVESEKGKGTVCTIIIPGR